MTCGRSIADKRSEPERDYGLAACADADRIEFLRHVDALAAEKQASKDAGGGKGKDGGVPRSKSAKR